MKKWTPPEVAELDIACIEQGKSVSTDFDEVGADQNDNYRVSFTSGADSKPDLDETITVNR